MIPPEQRFAILCQNLTTRKLLRMYTNKCAWMETAANSTGDAAFYKIRDQREWELRHCEQVLRARTDEKTAREQSKQDRALSEKHAAARSALWAAFQGAFMGLKTGQDNRTHLRTMALAIKQAAVVLTADEYDYDPMDGYDPNANNDGYSS